MAHRTQTPTEQPDPPETTATDPLIDTTPKRTTKVVEEESLATAAAGPHRPEPAKQVFHDPGGPVLQPETARRRAVAPAAKVRAIRDGYIYEARRRVGDVFSLLDMKDFSDTWMEMVDGSTPEKVSTGKDVLKRHHDEIQGARLAGDEARAGRGTGDRNVLEE